MRINVSLQRAIDLAVDSAPPIDSNLAAQKFTQEVSVALNLIFVAMAH
jgi:hypothetical protein